MSPDEIRRKLEFYQDLGIKEIYRRSPEGAAARENSLPGGRGSELIADGSELNAGGSELNAGSSESVAGLSAESRSDVELPGMAPAGDTLKIIQADIGECTRCRLHKGRNKLVFGVGNAEARLVFVGEGPGADEDEQGIPFVGRAGQLLTQMIENTASKEGIPLKRPDVYICNVVKCRPPENRTPEPDEMEICGQFLFRQLSVIKPKAICALGSTAAKALLGGKDGVTRLRGKWHKWHDIPLIVTYHPSYLLRPYNQNAKREAWEDLKKVLHFVYD